MAVLGVVALYAAGAGVWFMASQASWEKAQKKYAKSCAKYDRENDLLSESRKWNDLYEAESQAMKSFPVDKGTDTVWLRTIEALAQANNVLIRQPEPLKEVEGQGDVSSIVRELPISIQEVNGSLQAIVRFMHALENTEDGMFNISAVRLRPDTGKAGYLKGSMTVMCAYMREKN